MTTVEVGSETPSKFSLRLIVTGSRRINFRLTMRLSDAGLRGPKAKLVYPDHRLPPWLTEDAAPRSLEPIVRGWHRRMKNPGQIERSLPTETAPLRRNIVRLRANFLKPNEAVVKGLATLGCTTGFEPENTTLNLVIEIGQRKRGDCVLFVYLERTLSHREHLTMRLSDAGLHQRQTKALYLDHRPTPWPTEDAAPRSLEPMVRPPPFQLAPASRSKSKCRRVL